MDSVHGRRGQCSRGAAFTAWHAAKPSADAHEQEGSTGAPHPSRARGAGGAVADCAARGRAVNSKCGRIRARKCGGMTLCSCTCLRCVVTAVLRPVDGPRTLCAAAWKYKRFTVLWNTRWYQVSMINMTLLSAVGGSRCAHVGRRAWQPRQPR